MTALPPEPGEIGDEDHGIPGPPEPYPDDDHEAGDRELAEGDKEDD